MTKSVFGLLERFFRQPKPQPLLGTPWPRKVYFLDGPLKGEVRSIDPCLYYVAEIHNYGGAFVAITYVWDTLYRHGLIAYMRLADPKIQPEFAGYAVL